MRTYGEELIEEGIQRGLEQGRALGQAEGVLRILASRGILVDEQVRQLILTCTDIVLLDRWFDRSLNATSLSEVLDDLAS